MVGNVDASREKTGRVFPTSNVVTAKTSFVINDLQLKPLH